MWKSPFNKVVRSHEALIMGILIGIVFGLLVVPFIPIRVEHKVYEDPIQLCGGKDNIEYVEFNYQGHLRKVKCGDGRVLDSF